MKKVRLFSTPICPYCLTLKRFLEENGVEVESIDVSQDEEAQKEMVEKTKQATVPVLDIDGQFVVGFDRKKICEILGIED
ncbi:MAG: glutaredoxin domain-containing protein [Candidatus Pacebacteria bacterium]|nr:glutaredoxin domain-containing protein [Candidatus Paceibacterota bacterium]MDD5555233.1 glutaredoxin domain-containing protein [Candidatus Paceibacterota bacterium]